MATVKEYTKKSAAGFGDISGGLRYRLVHETQKWPEIILATDFLAPTGGEPNTSKFDQTLGNGYWQLSGGLTIIKSFDPAVLFGGLGYAHRFDSTLRGVDVQWGDKFSFNYGMGFALNQKLTASGQFLATYEERTKVNGVKKPI